MKRELACILLAVLSFVVLAPLLGDVFAHFSIPRGAHIMQDDHIPAWMYWCRWGGKIVGRVFGDLICGFLLGRYSHRVNPWRVYLGLLGLPVLILLLYRGFWDANDGMWVRSVGEVGAAVQLIGQLLAIAAVLALGIWMGRRRMQFDV